MRTLDRKSPKGSSRIRASVRSLPLALYGLDGVRIRLHNFLKNLGVDCGFDEVSIGRIDFAIDVLAPGFFLEPENFVMHAHNNRTDRAENVPYAQSGHSGNFTSVTIGKMPGRQVIVYDKRAEVIAKHKPEWWEIWNNERRRQGQPELVSGDREAANIWRIEIRAGKKHLKDKWDVTHWSSLHDRLPHIMRKAVQEIRYCAPTSDTNRSRWPNDALWEAAKSETLEISNFPDPDIPIPAIRELILRDKADMLTAQIIGNAATLSKIYQLPHSRAHEISGFVDHSISQFIKSQPDEFEAKRQRAEAKYFLT